MGCRFRSIPHAGLRGRSFAVPGVGLLIGLLLAGCMGPRFPSAPEPTGSAPEPTGSAPEPVPAGALYGRVMRQDGRPATRSTVQAYQLTNEDKVKLGAAMLSLGFFCLIPSFCPKPVSAPVNRQGGFTFPTDKIKPVPHITITARHAPDHGQVTGPVVVAQFDRIDGAQQRVPDLRYWEPTITVRRDGTNARVSWPALSHATGYALWTVTVGSTGSAGIPQPTGVSTKGTDATLDLRPFEDQPTALILAATIPNTVAGQQVTFAYQSASVPLPSVGAPGSRGRPCLAGDPGTRLIVGRSPCPLTDGILDINADVAKPCPSGGTQTGTSSGGTSTGGASSGGASSGSASSGGAASCPQVATHRICVDLGVVRPVSLVVYRTPFSRDDTTVELSSDGVTFRRVGHAVGSGDTGSSDTGSGDKNIYPVRIEPPQRASLACVRNDRFGFAGAILNELSVW